MTKTRPPLTIDAALARIAGQLQNGWTEMAAITERAERTVRNWGDPDTPEQIPMDCAIKLDLAFEASGGIGTPIFEVYALLINVERVTRFGDVRDVIRRTMTGIKENAEAAIAQIASTLPGAGPHATDDAIRETQEAIEADTSTLAALHEMRSGKRPAAPP